MFDLYENIKNLAAKHGYTPSGLCTAMGMSKSTLSNLKNGRAESLSQVVLKRIADFLDEPFDLVAHGVNKKDPSTMTDAEVDEELHEILTELKDSEELRMLFHATKGASADQIRMLADMVNGFKNGGK